MTSRRLNREETRGHIINETIRKLQENSDATTTFAQTLLDDATAAEARTTLGLGTASVLDFTIGAWTPVLAFGGTVTGITYTTQLGTFVKIGRAVWLMASIILTSNGSGTGAATISGFATTPGTPVTAAGLNFVGSFGNYTNISSPVQANFHCMVANAGTTLQLFRHGAGNNQAAMLETDIDDDATFSISIFYYTA